MASGQDWIIDEIDDDAVAAALGAAEEADLPVAVWLEHAIIEASRRDGLAAPHHLRPNGKTHNVLDSSADHGEYVRKVAEALAPRTLPAPVPSTTSVVTRGRIAVGVLALVVVLAIGRLLVAPPPADEDTGRDTSAVPSGKAASETGDTTDPLPGRGMQEDADGKAAVEPRAARLLAQAVPATLATGGGLPDLEPSLTPATDRTAITQGPSDVDSTVHDLRPGNSPGAAAQQRPVERGSEATTSTATSTGPAEPAPTALPVHLLADDLPTEIVNVLPRHEAPDPIETERAYREQQGKPSPPVEPTAKPTADELTKFAAKLDLPPSDGFAVLVSPPSQTPNDNAAVAEEQEGDSDPLPPLARPADTLDGAAAPQPIGEGDVSNDSADLADSGLLPSAEAQGESVAALAPAMLAEPDDAGTDDVPESVAAFIDAAEGGDPDAQHDLGLIYIQGLDVPRDYEMAAYWFQESARQGNADAQYNLGVMYDEGLGVNRDPIEGLVLFLSAAEQGHVAAQYNAGLAYAEGKHIPRNFAEARRWFKAAADQGLAEAQYQLGIIYEHGLGVAKDDVAAYRYYGLAAETGHTDAVARLKAVDKRLDPDQRASAEELIEEDGPSTGGTVIQDAARLDRQGIREVQRLLKEIGYDPGKADGFMGERTEAAIRRFQQSQGLLVSGIPTSGLLAQLRKANGQ